MFISHLHLALLLQQFENPYLLLPAKLGITPIPVPLWLTLVFPCWLSLSLTPGHCPLY